MKYLILTLIYMFKDWNLSMDDFKLTGKILWYIPNLLHNILVVIFRLILSPLIFLWVMFFDKYKLMILRFYVYWIHSLVDMFNWFKIK
jgi:hypothetical protein